MYEPRKARAYGSIWRLPIRLFASDDIVKRALVSLTIEKTLFEMGEPVFDKVTSLLNKKYSCYIPDCYDHPEYLKDVLENLFGSSHKEIIKSIKDALEEFSYHATIQEFLVVIDS